MSVEQHEKRIRALNSSIDKVSEDEVAKIKTFNQEGVQICSFSSSNLSIVMWSHYSANHTGFCIEYDLSDLLFNDPRILGLFPVIYTNALFDATDYFKSGLKGGTFNNFYPILAAMHKSPEWEYEKEWRFILPMGSEEPMGNMPMPTPRAIYLGTRITTENTNKLVKIASSKNIKVYQMQLSSTKFAPEPKRLEL